MASRSSVMATLRFAPTSRMVYLCGSDPSNDPTAVQPLLNLQQAIDICPRLGSKLKLPAAHGFCSTNSSLPYKTDAARASCISRARFNGRVGDHSAKPSENRDVGCGWQLGFLLGGISWSMSEA
jgi:hypothetical protein